MQKNAEDGRESESIYILNLTRVGIIQAWPRASHWTSTYSAKPVLTSTATLHILIRRLTHRMHAAERGVTHVGLALQVVERCYKKRKTYH